MSDPTRNPKDGRGNRTYFAVVRGVNDCNLSSGIWMFLFTSVVLQAVLEPTLSEIINICFDTFRIQLTMQRTPTVTTLVDFRLHHQ